jgi:hypothetical protein
MKDICIVLMFDKKFAKKSQQTIDQIRNIGQFNGDIVCILGNDLHDRPDLLHKGDNIIYNKFFQYYTDPILKHPKRLSPEAFKCFPMKQKMIHYHGFYMFHTWFRENYKKCFYIDVGAQIFKPLDKMLNLDCTGKLLTHSNAYPDYAPGDKLYTQFDKVIFPELYEELNTLYNLDVDHFQATVMLYDTTIIEDDTFNDLWNLAYRYVNSIANEQAIMNLYFGCMKHCWEQFPIKDNETYYYDFYERGNLKKTDYIIVKYPKT